MPVAPENETFLDRPIDRRALIRRGIAFVGASALVPPAFLRAVFDENSASSAHAATLPPAQRKVLVVLQLAGGNDGLNTVVPVADRAYYTARPGLAINPEAALPLPRGLALNPVMSGMKSLYDRGQLGIVLGVGYPNPNRSHFRSMDIWHSASFEEHAETGWLGRLLDATRHEQNSAWRAANIGNEQPASLDSRASFVPSLGSVPAYVLQTDTRFPAEGSRRTQAFVQLHAQAEGLARQAAYGGQLAFLSKTGLQAYQSTVDLQRAVSAYTPRVTYPNTPLASAFLTAAQLVASTNLGTGVCYITTGGFDTHAGQTGAQNNLLGTVSNALLAFYDDLNAQGLGEAVTTVVWTEFGRRVKENGSRGTDHGTAGPLFVVGGGVKPGLHGDQPAVGSTDENGDLKYSTDFRSVYASIIAQRFRVDPKDVLGASFPTLPLFA